MQITLGSGLAFKHLLIAALHRTADGSIMKAEKISYLFHAIAMLQIGPSNYTVATWPVFCIDSREKLFQRRPFSKPLIYRDLRKID